MKNVLRFLALILISQAAMADVCLDKRLALLSHFNKNLDSYNRYIGEYGYANVHEAEDVLESDEFTAMCSIDQKKFKRIVYSTFRMILVDKEDKPIETEANEITGTLVGPRTWVVSFPQKIYSSFINNWTKDKSLRIKLINYEGEEAIASYIDNNNMVWVGGGKYASILKSLEPAEKLNAKFVEGSLISIPLENIVADYPSFLTNPADITSFRKNIFFLGYDDDELNIGFGLNSAYKDEHGMINVTSSKLVSDKTFGGGAYNENFDLVGMHYETSVYSDTNKKDEYKKGFNVINSLPKTIVEGISRWIRVDENINQMKIKLERQKAEKTKVAPILPRKGTSTKDY